MATLKLIYRTNQTDKTGRAPLYFRLTKDRKAKYISIGVKLLPKEWDEENKRVRKSHANSNYLNNFIAIKRAEVEKLGLELETGKVGLTENRIKQELSGKESGSFIDYADQYLASLYRQGKISYYKNLKATLSKLKTFCKNKDLQFEQITVPFLKKFEIHMRENLENKDNTIHNNMKLIRRLIYEAIEEGRFPYDKNPFKIYKLKWAKTSKQFLTEDQLKLVDELPLNPHSKMWHHRNMYIFAAYAGGLRISDLLKLKWMNFDGERVVLSMKKTEDTVSIKLPRRALEILALYTPEKPEPEAFVFPIFTSEKDYSDPEILNRSISSSTAYANKNLALIAKKCGIPHRMSFHSSRHTWATRALRKGMRIEYVSKLMGHQSVKTTEIYAKIVNAELDAAMGVFDE